MVVQNISSNGKETDLTFTIKNEDLNKTKKIIKENKNINFRKLLFKKGVSKIYEKLNFICLPVALNSGDVWPKLGRLNSNKTITISILNQIPAGMTTQDFQKKIEEDLYNELDRIR